jgi:peroxiredoxin
MDSIVRLDGPVPDFKLKNLDGSEHALSGARGKVVVIVFWSAECPWSRRADTLIQSWCSDWGEQVLLWMIASNVNEGLEMIEEVKQARGIETVLLDEDHEIADRFGAVTTPHCFVIDEQGRLRYRGAIDDTTFRQREATQYYLHDAVMAVRSGNQPNPADTPGYGCTIVRAHLT